MNIFGAIGKGIKTVGNWFDKHPGAKIAVGGILGGVGGLASAGGAHLLNKGIAQSYGDYSALAAAQSAQKAYEASQTAIRAANAAKSTAVDTINLASKFVEK